MLRLLGSGFLPPGPGPMWRGGGFLPDHVSAAPLAVTQAVPVVSESQFKLRPAGDAARLWLLVWNVHWMLPNIRLQLAIEEIRCTEPETVTGPSTDGADQA